ncbi:pentatricopeptide repeat-containing protein at2g29760 chloroplastic [Phtheirospermum japonicum]|uniref:Pentatricopeptide repeat-containing protein at2g29760 chloroplastic n=1 Tax=Phtheirospermum japonicum TaxID=374723 RepID=A0A830CWJ1_9LAMI|nr:pentatricopeptide repeat-containing protein at2g29760 chloroplastic [Phtheirospermum japonicum]
MLRAGLFSDPFSASKLVHSTALSEFSSLHYAHQVFDQIPQPNLYSWNVLIRAYAECGLLDMARRAFTSMPERDAVSWNSMIKGLVQNGCADEAIEFFRRMGREIDLKPNDVTVVGVLSACGKKMDLKLGKWVHSYINKNGIAMSLILCNAILDMYTKCGSTVDARKLFDTMPEKDIISWTTMLAGYARLGDFKEAIAIFNELQISKAAKPDEVTLVSTLSACSQLGAMELGCWIHVYTKKESMKLNCHLVTALIDMYSKCGDLNKALEVFYSVDKRDVFVWSAMIAGLGMHGRGKDAVDVFLRMREAKVKPSSVTFTNLLSACSHSGLVEEGREFFGKMDLVYKIAPSVEHYACMVDILGRAGLLDEAVELIENMPMKPGASVWGALLGACRLHRNVDLAENACERLLEIEPRNHGAYVLLSNIYASSGKWDEVSKMRKRMRDVGLKKEPGCSSVEVNGVVHEFLVGDNTHPMSKEIYAKLEEVAGRIKCSGYVSKKSEILQVVEEGDMQEKALYLHSERLALAFGLLSNRSSQPIRIVKNLRVCEDCHAVIKLVSEIYDREIVVRDRYRFHHFKGGCCSCKDYW